MSACCYCEGVRFEGPQFLGQFFELELRFGFICSVSGGFSGLYESSRTDDPLKFVELDEFGYVECEALDCGGIGEFAGSQLHEIVAEISDGGMA